MESTSGGGYYGYGGSSVKENIKAAQSFHCPDCGHNAEHPYPPLPTEIKTNAPQGLATETLTCYITKQNLLKDAPQDELFGFGIAKGGSAHNPSLTSPCEFMSFGGFKALAAAGKVESVMRDEIQFFLPMFINPQHGAKVSVLLLLCCCKVFILFSLLIDQEYLPSSYSKNPWTTTSRRQT